MTPEERTIHHKKKFGWKKIKRKPVTSDEKREKSNAYQRKWYAKNEAHRQAYLKQRKLERKLAKEAAEKSIFP